MKLTLNLEHTKFSVNLADEECHALFDLLVAQILHFEPVKKEVKSAIQRGDIHVEEIRRKETETSMKPAVVPKINILAARPDKAFLGHTGFLYIRCPKCGEERGFCAKYPITEATCKKCGKRIPLPEKLAPISFRCECGKTYKYLTNITDPMFDIPCMECGTPNTVVLNHKTGSYVDAKRVK